MGDTFDDNGVGGASPARMSWQETNPVNERMKSVAATQSGRLHRTKLCEKFGISRKTGSKLLSRYESDGPGGLCDQSRAPYTHPNPTASELEGAILRVRKLHPTLG